MTQEKVLKDLDQKSKALIEWLKHEISIDEAVPILAVSLGTILRAQAAGAPPAHLEEGVDIACAMVRVAAFNKPVISKSLKERRNHGKEK